MEAVIQMIKQALFVLGEEKYGMDIMEINIIERTGSVEKVPGLSENFKGIIRLRGDIVPVYSLRRRFGLADIPYDDDTRFVISSCGGMTVAYEVDKVVEILQLEDDQLYGVPEIAVNNDNCFMKSVINHNGQLIVILDPEKIMTEQERAAVDKIVNKNN